MPSSLTSKIRSYFSNTRNTVWKPKPNLTVTSVIPPENQEETSTHPLHPTERQLQELHPSSASIESHAPNIASIVSSGGLLQLPELPPQNENVMNVISLARSKRAEQSVRKQFAERRIHLCEENLQALQQELLDADRSLQEVDSYITGLRETFQQNAPLVTANPLNSGSASSTLPSYPAYESEPSEDSGSIKSSHRE